MANPSKRNFQFPLHRDSRCVNGCLAVKRVRNLAFSSLFIGTHAASIRCGSSRRNSASFSS
ncbi:MAG: hypothetical protein ACP5Q3_15210, partial [bacterium]